MTVPLNPDRECGICPRLRAFILEQRAACPDWHNAPVDTWAAGDGDDSVELLIAGLAPGLKGANRTGRPFTGDYAGDLLYGTLLKFGFAQGKFGGHAEDGVKLVRCAITNAVRCVPPQNKPVGAEINNCRPFLEATIKRFPNLKTIVTLGKISHDSTIRALGEKPSHFPFGHCIVHEIAGLQVRPSYHCSRYNTNTGRLTVAMFEEVFQGVLQGLG